MSWLFFAWSRLGGMFLARGWALVDSGLVPSLAGSGGGQFFLQIACVSSGLGTGDQGEGHGSDAGCRGWGQAFKEQLHEADMAIEPELAVVNHISNLHLFASSMLPKGTRLGTGCLLKAD